MDIGMLWFDNDPKTDLISKVTRAADYYRKKYQQDPNCCFVHPSLLPTSEKTAGSIIICSNKSVIPHHFWIGVQQPILTQRS